MEELRRVVLRQLGLNIRALRIGKGMTQEQLAAFAGVNRNYINQVEAGRRNVSILNLVRIADALGVTADQIVAGVKG